MGIPGRAIFDRFIDSHVGAWIAANPNADESEASIARVGAVWSIVSRLALIGYVAVFFIEGRTGSAVVFAGLVTVMTAVDELSARSTHMTVRQLWHIAIGMMLLFFTWSAIVVNGGPESVSSHLLYLIPLAATPALGPRYSLMWTVLAFAGLTAIFVFDQLVDVPPETETPWTVSATSMVTIISIVGVAAVSARGAADRQVEEIAALEETLQAQTATLAHAEMQARQAETAAEQAAERKSAFLATMSHELRTPLNGVVGMADVLAGVVAGNGRATPDAVRDGGNENAAELAEPGMGTIIASGRRLLNLIDNVLDDSKAAAGRFEVSSEPFPLLEVLANASLGAELEIAPDVPAWASGDGTHVLGAIRPLVQFALDRGTATVRVEPIRTDRVRIEITDDNPALPDEVALRTLDHAPTGDTADVLPISQRLRLSVALRLISLMDGKTEIRADPDGPGSRITVELHLPAADAVKPKLPHWHDQSVVGGLHVLVVEDDPVNRRVTTAHLQKIGCTVAVARDGLEAIEILEGDRFDAVLMDIHMPRLDGHGALARIRRREAGRKPIPVIALTADIEGLDGPSTGQEAGPDTRTDTGKAAAPAFDDVLEKPFTSSELLTTIARAVRSVSADGQFGDDLDHAGRTPACP